MKSNPVRVYLESHDLPWIGAGSAALFGLWRVNAGKLGALYDASSLTCANGLLQEGWKPHRDFVTPLQSLIFYAGWLCEAIFGRRYVSLAYGNLALAFVLFAVTYLFTRKVAGRLVGMLAALAICSMNPLQHAIIWYNGLGILWIVAISAVTFPAIARARFRAIDLAGLGALLFLAGSTKLNFMLIGLIIVFFGLACVAVSHRSSARWLLPAAFMLAILATALPIWCELLVTGTDWRTWVFQVIQLPASRANGLMLLQQFFLPEVRDFYRGDALRAIFGVAVLPYAAIGWWLWTEHPAVLTRLATIATLGLFYGTAAVLAASNVDIACGEPLLLIGLVAVLAGFSPSLGASSRRWLRGAVLLFSGWFLVAGTITMVRHARQNYGDGSHRDYLHRLSDPPYLQGTDLSDSSYVKLRQAQAWLAEFGVSSGSSRVYWGPGVAIFARVFETELPPGFPLWFHLGVSVRESDGREIAQRLERSPVEIFIADPYWMREMPKDTKDYLKTWQRREAQGLVCYTRRTPRSFQKSLSGAGVTAR
jgi:MFS family permease